MSDPADLPVIGIRVAAGVTIAVPGRIDLLTPYVLLEQENWFEDEIAFLCGCLRAGARVVDIGANYGLYSLSLAQVAGPAGRVWSVEPASQTAAYLRKSVEINGFANVTVLQKALSNRPGTARLSVEANSELNSIAQAAHSGTTEEVQLDTLDALAAAHDWGGIDFLKLDAEGEEERILEGGAAFLRSASPLVMSRSSTASASTCNWSRSWRRPDTAPTGLFPASTCWPGSMPGKPPIPSASTSLPARPTAPKNSRTAAPSPANRRPLRGPILSRTTARRMTRGTRPRCAMRISRQPMPDSPLFAPHEAARGTSPVVRARPTNSGCARTPPDC